MSEDGPTHLCVNANSCADEVGCRRILTFRVLNGKLVQIYVDFGEQNDEFFI